MKPFTPQIVAWVAHHILPHEALVRAMLRKSLVNEQDIDDLINDAYCKLSNLSTTDHIEQPLSYFLRVVRNLHVDWLRRARIVRIESATENLLANVLDESPSPERVAEARRELAKVQEIISSLPERCREIFNLRKVEGLSQREIALKIGVSENVVESDVAKGLRLVSAALSRGRITGEAQSAPKRPEQVDRSERDGCALGGAPRS